jgi:hypothetical protein
MNKLLLPNCEPPITSWTWHANLLSIIYPIEKTHDWIFSNYLHLYLTEIDRFGKRQVLDFWPRYLVTFHCPYIFSQILSRRNVIKFSGGNVV